MFNNESHQGAWWREYGVGCEGWGVVYLAGCIGWGDLGGVYWVGR